MSRLFRDKRTNHRGGVGLTDKSLYVLCRVCGARINRLSALYPCINCGARV